MTVIHFGLQETPGSSCEDDFLYKPVGHIYTKFYIEHWDGKFYAL